MLKSFKEKWVKALRSKKFKQVKSRLRRKRGESVGYCCLGVACEIAGLENQRGKGYTFAESYSGIKLPEAFRSKIKLSVDDEMRLARMNDCHGSDFDKIANYIEKHL